MTSIRCVERDAGGEDAVNRWIHVKPAMFVCRVCAQWSESTSLHFLIIVQFCVILNHTENLLLSIIRRPEGWLLMMLLTSDFSLCGTQKVTQLTALWNFTSIYQANMFKSIVSMFLQLVSYHLHVHEQTLGRRSYSHRPSCWGWHHWIFNETRG